MLAATSQEKKPHNKICLTSVLILDFPDYRLVRHAFQLIKPSENNNSNMQHHKEIRVNKGQESCGSTLSMSL